MRCKVNKKKKYYSYKLLNVSIFFDYVDYIADAVLGHPQCAEKRGKKAYTVEHLLSPFAHAGFIPADYSCHEL